MTFDPKKPVQTRDGLPVRIICTDRKGHLPIVALISESGGETVRHFGPTGVSPFNRDFDLVNIPEKHVRWVNAYRHSDDRQPLFKTWHEGRRDADLYAGNMPHVTRIACIRVEFSEGDGL